MAVPCGSILLDECREVCVQTVGNVNLVGTRLLIRHAGGHAERLLDTGHIRSPLVEQVAISKRWRRQSLCLVPALGVRQITVQCIDRGGRLPGKLGTSGLNLAVGVAQ